METVFIKVGGSFITVKNRPISIREEALNSLTKILNEVIDGYRLVLGNGGGSFAHYTVMKYRESDYSTLLVKCHQSTRMLNRIIVDYLVSEGIKATSLQTSAIVGYRGDELIVFPEPIHQLLHLDVVPVVYGECVPSPRGVDIFSTERVFELLSPYLKPSRIVLLTDVPGVLSCDPKSCSNPELIPVINEENMEQVLANLEKAGHADATGGMKAKVETMASLSRRLGVEVYVVSGFDIDSAIDAVNGRMPQIGTLIKLSA